MEDAFGMNKRVGIVLKCVTPRQQRLTVLDSHMGRIECRAERHHSIDRLTVGVLMQYQIVRQRGQAYGIAQIDVLHAPFEVAKYDLLFLHHVVEIADHFVAFGHVDNDVFNLLVFVVVDGQRLHTLFQKKVFLCKLFCALSMYPEDNKSWSAKLRKLAIGAIDNLFDINIDLEIEKELDCWLLKCIAMHPGAEHFKTNHFITKNRVL